MEQNKISLKDGFFKQNIVFMSGLVIAPVIACATTLMKSLAICMVFSLVSFFTILICRAVPRKIAFTLRVIIHSLVAAALYIPVMILTCAVFSADVIASTGVYLPIIVTNSLILSKSETRFYGESFADMTIDCAAFIGGFDIACVFAGAVRELLAKGTLGGIYINMPFTIPALETTFGGFLFVGVCAGIFRGIYNYRKEQALNDEPDEEDELLEYAEDMGEFLTGKKHNQTEKMKIYKSPKKHKNKTEPEDILEMSFNDNSSLVDEFAAIVAEGAELVPDSDEGDEKENWDYSEQTAENSEDDAATVNTEEAEE